MHTSDLRQKEIICTTDGVKLGFADDLEFEEKTYRISAIICQRRSGFWLFGRRDAVRIPVEQIKVIGEDIILVAGYQGETRLRTGKSVWDHFFE